jgi:hypothetical protein
VSSLNQPLLHAAEDDACATERLETEHGSGDAFDCPVVLLNEVVEVLADLN